MRKTLVDPFTVNLPTLDLHGEISSLVPNLINTFIDDSFKMGYSKVVIIHGKGSGIIKKTTQEVLRKNRKIERFYIDGANDGMTVVILKNQP